MSSNNGGPYKEQKKALHRIERYLDRLNIDYELKETVDFEGHKTLVIYTTYIRGDFQFDIIISNVRDWFTMKCFILDLEDLSQDQILAVFRLGLELNYKLFETTFSVLDNRLYIEADMSVKASFEDFQLELNSISIGVDNFVPKIKQIISINSTNGKLFS